MSETCQQKIYSGAGWNRTTTRCSQPVKEDGLCGKHAGIKKRTAKAREKADAAYETRRAEWAKEREFWALLRASDTSWTARLARLQQILGRDA